jgi:hypothetical protein
MPLILSGSAGLSGNVGNVTKDMLPAGSVLQVVQIVKSDTFAGTMSTNWGDVPGMVASITPANAANKILVQVDLKVSSLAGSSVGRARLLRNNTPVYIGDAAGSRARAMGQIYGGAGADNVYQMEQVGGTYLDSPNSTSPVTYKIQMGGDNDASVLYVNRTQSDRDTAYYDARVVSSITLMEIKG